MEKLFIAFVLVYSLTASTNLSAQNSDYFVAFCSHTVNASSLGGHAFVAIGKGEPFTCNIDGTETEVFGLYAQDTSQPGCTPSSYDAAKSFFVGALPGCLFDDARTQVDHLLVIRCDSTRYLQILTQISSWKNKNYQLSVQDCVTFVQAIAQSFSYLQIPDRSGSLNYPNQYVLELIKENGQNITDH